MGLNDGLWVAYRAIFAKMREALRRTDVPEPDAL